MADPVEPTQLDQEEEEEEVKEPSPAQASNPESNNNSSNNETEAVELDKEEDEEEDKQTKITDYIEKTAQEDKSALDDEEETVEEEANKQNDNSKAEKKDLAKEKSKKKKKSKSKDSSEKDKEKKKKSKKRKSSTTEGSDSEKRSKKRRKKNTDAPSPENEEPIEINPNAAEKNFDNEDDKDNEDEEAKKEDEEIEKRRSSEDKKKDAAKTRKEINEQIERQSDEAVKKILEDMEMAYFEDKKLISEGKPALAKISMLQRVEQTCLNYRNKTKLIENKLLDYLGNWLEPPNLEELRKKLKFKDPYSKKLIPHYQLPNQTIRTAVLIILNGLPLDSNSEESSSRSGRKHGDDEDTASTGIEETHLKNSCVLKWVALLSKHPSETKKNRKVAIQLIEKWTRVMLGIGERDQSYRMDENVNRDIKPQADWTEKNKMSLKDLPKEMQSIVPQRARIPISVGFNFVKMPENKIAPPRSKSK